MSTILTNNETKTTYILCEENTVDIDVVTRINSVFVDGSTVIVSPVKETLIIISPDHKVEVFDFSELPLVDKNFWSNPEFVKNIFTNLKDYDTNKYVEVDETHWDDVTVTGDHVYPPVTVLDEKIYMWLKNHGWEVKESNVKGNIWFNSELGFNRIVYYNIGDEPLGLEMFANKMSQLHGISEKVIIYQIINKLF